MFGNYAKCCDKASFAVPDEARGELVKAPCLEPQSKPLWSGPRGAERFIPVTGWLRCLLWEDN